MRLHDSTRITHDEAERFDEDVLRRWLEWALKEDPSAARIRRESMGSKKEILQALAWIGAIQ